MCVPNVAHCNERAFSSWDCLWLPFRFSILISSCNRTVSFEQRGTVYQEQLNYLYMRNFYAHIFHLTLTFDTTITRERDRARDHSESIFHKINNINNKIKCSHFVSGKLFFIFLRIIFHFAINYFFKSERTRDEKITENEKSFR